MSATIQLERAKREQTHNNGLETLEVGDTLNDGGKGVELLLSILVVVSLSLETDSESLGRVSDTLGPDGLVELGVDPDPVDGEIRKREVKEEQVLDGRGSVVRYKKRRSRRSVGSWHGLLGEHHLGSESLNGLDGL